MRTRLCYAGIALFAGLIAFDGPSDTDTHNPVKSTVAAPAVAPEKFEQFTIRYVQENVHVEPRQGNFYYNVQMVNNGPDIWGGDISVALNGDKSYSEHVTRIPHGQIFTRTFEVDDDNRWNGDLDDYSVSVDGLAYVHELDPDYVQRAPMNVDNDFDIIVEDRAYELAEEISGRR